VGEEHARRGSLEPVREEGGTMRFKHSSWKRAQGEGLPNREARQKAPKRGGPPEIEDSKKEKKKPARRGPRKSTKKRRTVGDVGGTTRDKGGGFF